MTDQTTADRHVAEARRAVHESLTLLPAWEADRVRSLIADLESAVESRTAVRMADAAPLPVSEARTRLLQALDASYCQALGHTPEGLLAAYDASRTQAVDPAAPDVWVDGHPQLEAIAAAVWERCGRSDSGMCVEDDPRNIAVAALAAVLPTTNHDTDTSVYASRAAEAELYVLLRKAGEPRDEAQALIDRHRDEVLHRAELRRVADETAATETQPVDLPALAAALDGFATLLATSSRDWGVYRVDAWLYAVICGWDCEQTEHDATCTHGALEEMAELHGWDDATVAKARRYRAAVRTLIETHQPAAGARQDGAQA
ncbi:hypothetical protein ABZX63_36385 [Streptomyces tendae]|uniref:hypothetical protein n=1 Tax=Streptomyces tendae TaxID=1932 RepID=UPI0033B18F46